MTRKKRPIRGDIIKLRGRTPSGILRTMNDNLWCCVEWFNNDGPKYCHLYEMEVIQNG